MVGGMIRIRRKRRTASGSGQLKRSIYQDGRAYSDGSKECIIETPGDFEVGEAHSVCMISFGYQYILMTHRKKACPYKSTQRPVTLSGSATGDSDHDWSSPRDIGRFANSRHPVNSVRSQDRIRLNGGPRTLEGISLWLSDGAVLGAGF